MIENILDFFLSITDIFYELKFWKKKKARRKFEKENNLPKKVIIHPYLKFLGIFLILILTVRILFGNLFHSNNEELITKKKIAKIKQILEDEKKIFGVYPEKLNTIIRNNPLRKNITMDYWKNEFYYEQLENGKDYLLLSKGKDGILKTKDDINGEK
ncbi:hypothetical protein [uncultured Polaribacter sp.]|uniref:hypothetical protein n=1 Tax=uncultured Polaribacter sp. TaxID=174711 RepID=UPI00262F8C56|nr:hypothetical protein [uncultured Polaribacter sp.]